MSNISRLTSLAAAGVSRGPTEIGEEFGGGFYAGNIVEGGVEYYLIVAPKASGQSSTKLKQKTTRTTSPAATRTLNNGPAASASMVGSTYPAANFCNGLTIGGFSDWYLPARDELEVCYRNLKPSSTANSTINRDKSTITYPEGNDLSSDTMGVNRNSNPVGAAYTTGTPSQTSSPASVPNFLDGGAESFVSSSSVNDSYWSSSEFDAANGWFQNFGNGIQYSLNWDKDRPLYVRAIRRVAV